MTNSLFNRLYSYTERENKNSKENYLIEIFSFCLENDVYLFNQFLLKLNLENTNERIINTQKIYSYGRPDIEIYLPSKDTIILIECKVEHIERENQLNDYCKILAGKKNKKKVLVYLTKYYENKSLLENSVEFNKLRWYNIYEILLETKNCFSIELLNYLKIENMAEQKNFNYTDLSLIYNVPQTIKKMDETIDSIGDYFEVRIGNLSKESSRSTRLKDNWYATYQWVENDKMKLCYQISIGFFWWWDDNEIYVGLNFWLKTTEKYNKSIQLRDILIRNLKKKDWEYDEDELNENRFHIGKFKKLSEFIVNNEEQIPEISKFIMSCIDQIEEIKKMNRSYFK